MIEIKELRALRGPNRHSRHPSIFMVLDIKEFEERPSNEIEGFTDRLVDLIPSLQEHGCSIGKPGGFIQRLKEGTWAGHIIEHIAIELQCLAGMEVKYGKTLDTMQKGIYILAFQYLVETCGLRAAKDAIALFEAVVKGKFFDINQVILNLIILSENYKLGPTTASIVNEAKSRGIPSLRLNDDSYIQLGYGAFQKRIQASITSDTSAIAVEIADEKTRTKNLLSKLGIPVPVGKKVSSLAEGINFFYELKSPVVVKPDIGNHGNGSSIFIEDLDKFKEAFYLAKSYHPFVIIEEYVRGFDFRLLVINGKFVAAAKREPAHVIGDGTSSIKELIINTNMNPLRGVGHEKVLTQILIDDMTQSILSHNSLSLESCPPINEKIYLKPTANLSQGGTATDVTDEVSPEIRLMAERIALIIGLDCVGIDVLATDISAPLLVSGVKVVEVNAAPGFRMHLEPTIGHPRLVSKHLVDMLFPEKYVQVPIIGVTGTNGKTTVCKLISHTLKYSGKNVGLACTTGIEIDGISILSGDYSGPEGAEIVLREPTVNHIVLEIARGGIIRRGLGVDELDVGVLLNIGCDHIGTDWIETQEDLSLVKSTVVEVVKKSGASVLNADDKITMDVLGRARGKIILFSQDQNNPFLLNQINEGGTIITIDKRNVIIRNQKLNINVCTIEEIPLTFGGIIDFNISNALAAIGALHGLGIPIEQIRNGVMTFYPSPKQNPGRMNLFDFKDYKVLLDYGHNIDSVRALNKILPLITQGRKLALIHGSGSRTDSQIIDFGKELASIYDYIFIADFDPRNRPKGETQKLVKKGLLLGGFKEKNIEYIVELGQAIDKIFSMVKPGDFLLIQPDQLEPIMGQISELYRKFLIDQTA